MNHKSRQHISPYISPNLEVHKGLNKGGMGIFARERIEIGEHLATFGGTVLTYPMLKQLSKHWHSMSLQIENNLYLVSFETHQADYVNHSCNPNAGMRDENTLVAIHIIAAGQKVCLRIQQLSSSKPGSIIYR